MILNIGEAEAAHGLYDIKYPVTELWVEGTGLKNYISQAPLQRRMVR